MKIGWELTEKSAKIIHHGWCESDYIVASELKDPICHSNECQIGSFSSVATIYSHTEGVEDFSS